MATPIGRSDSPQRCEDVFHLGWHLAIDFSPNDALAFKFPQFLCEHFPAGLGNQSAAAARAGDIEAYAQHDLPFHRLIVESAQNGFLLRAWEGLGFENSNPYFPCF